MDAKQRIIQENVPLQMVALRGRENFDSLGLMILGLAKPGQIGETELLWARVSGGRLA